MILRSKVSGSFSSGWPGRRSGRRRNKPEAARVEAVTPLAYNGTAQSLPGGDAMIDRRKFVALLSAVPFIGKSMLAICQKPKDKPRVPPGYERCDVCNEYNGTTDASNLSWNSSQHSAGETITVSCRCHGILCRNCGKNLINRPISNTYYPASNQIEHWPYFAGLIPCSGCRAN